MSENRCEKDNSEPQIVSQCKFYAFCYSKGIVFNNLDGRGEFNNV